MHRAFITGCGSGFGRGLAIRLLAEGHSVVATDLDIEPDALAAILAPEGSERLTTVQLDVRDAEAVKRVAADVLASGPVDVVVNNAGKAVFGTIEETDAALVADLFDVNVIGAIRVTQAFLPSLRETKGTLVMLSSVAGRMVFPESGFYAATKYAVEALSEALFQECGSLGVRVRLIEPGSFATRFQERAAAESPPRAADSPYADLHDVWDDRRDAVLEDPQDAALVVGAIADSLDDPAPFLRLPVGLDAVRILALRDQLSPDAWSRLAADRVGLPAATHGPGEVLSAAEVVALWASRKGTWTDDERARLAPTMAAARLQHLDHWARTELGRSALLLLDS